MDLSVPQSCCSHLSRICIHPEDPVHSQLRQVFSGRLADWKFTLLHHNHDHVVQICSALPLHLEVLLQEEDAKVFEKSAKRRILCSDEKCSQHCHFDMDVAWFLFVRFVCLFLVEVHC